MDDDGISPRFDQSALITIDTQIDTLDGQPLEIPGTTAALPAIATLLPDSCRRGLAAGGSRKLCRPDRKVVTGLSRSFVERQPNGGVRPSGVDEAAIS